MVAAGSLWHMDRPAAKSAEQGLQANSLKGDDLSLGTGATGVTGRGIVSDYSAPSGPFQSVIRSSSGSEPTRSGTAPTPTPRDTYSSAPPLTYGPAT
jgi:hypothetical protein